MKEEKDVIRAPFNFVPINNTIAAFDNDVEHDIPYSDGICGEINFELEAITKVFIRDGQPKEIKSNEFCHIISNDEKKYFIPATSLKGMFRNVLEILSYSRMTVDERMRFAVRKWDKPKVWPMKEAAQKGKIYCGWLELDENGDWKLYDCGTPLRINHKWIDERFETNFCERFYRNSPTKIEDNNDEQKSAKFKYDILEKKQAGVFSKNFYFTEDTDYSTEYAQRYKFSKKETEITGKLVVTGQPACYANFEKGARKIGDAKFYEFIFSEKGEKCYEIPNEVFQQYDFIYEDDKLWKKCKNDRKIPVFFRKEGDKLLDFGFSYLYKIPYKYSVSTIVCNTQKKSKENSIDISELIFGKIRKNSEESSKGRVQFGHAFSENAKPYSEVLRKRLGSPKASYLPIYLAPEETERSYNKFVNIAGFKRYPIRAGADLTPPIDKNEKLDTSFIPLEPKSIFKCRARFHNLRPFELGALLSAITFHNHHDKLFHNIGLCKMFGFGKLKLSNIQLLIDNHEKNIQEFLEGFKMKLFHTIHLDLLNDPRIKELFTMAWGEHGKGEDTYMILDTKGKNEFLDLEKNNKKLKRFSQLANNTLDIIQASIDGKYRSLLAEAKKQMENDDFINAKLKLEEADFIYPKKHDHRELLQCVSENLAVLDDRKQREELKKQEELDKIAKFKVPLKDKIDHIRKINTLFDGVNKWLKNNELEMVQDADFEVVREKIASIYSSMKPREKKEWQRFEKWGQLSKLVGEDVARNWFAEIIDK